MEGIIMKTWIYFYIEHMIKNGEVFRKEPGWGLKKQYFYLQLN